MPAPKVFPCGGTNQPPCPPDNAAKTITKGDIVRAYRNLSPEDIQEGEAEIAAQESEGDQGDQ